MSPRQALAEAEATVLKSGNVVYVIADPFGDDGDFCTTCVHVHDWLARCYPGGRTDVMPEFARLIKEQVK